MYHVIFISIEICCNKTTKSNSSQKYNNETSCCNSASSKYNIFVFFNFLVEGEDFFLPGKLLIWKMGTEVFMCF